MEPGTWIGVAMGALALAGTVANNINTRRAAKDRAEADRLAALDKMQFDAKLLAQDAQIATLKAANAKCQEESSALKAEIAELKARDERDRRELEAQIKTVVFNAERQRASDRNTPGGDQ